MFGISGALLVLLFLCLVCACVFEFVNGFHDTANAVATVIYTNSLKPTTAVIWSGIWNFTGVFIGGITVAMGIVNLLPMVSLIDQDIYHNVAMILALLVTAIFWNLATWYIGIPCSSSHTLVGSILGVGLGFTLLPDSQITLDAINWKKASEIGLSLLISPLFGFSLAIFLMYLMRRLLGKNMIFKEPQPGQKPPTWIRGILILTCTGVSFAHGSNDGQKGVGLVMLILIGIIPAKFALDQTKDVAQLRSPIIASQGILSHIDQNDLSGSDADKFKVMDKSLGSLTSLLNRPDSLKEDRQAMEFRKYILTYSANATKLLDSKTLNLSKERKDELKQQLNGITAYTNYAPPWVILIISLSLGLGTMVGWKRIVVTIGEKIGKQHLNYAQGASAELVASSTIGVSTWLGLPVSTTHVLSSGIAGSMVASKGIKNLQAKTVRNILIAWVLTLPVCMLISALLFLGLRFIL